MKRIILCLFAAAFSMNATADVRCGDFLLTPSNDGFMHINGVRPESQKVTYLTNPPNDDNTKFEWRVATNQPGKWLGMEYIKRGGKKRFLNVQLLQASMDAPRQYATYDCVKVK